MITDDTGNQGCGAVHGVVGVLHHPARHVANTDLPRHRRAHHHFPGNG